MPTIEDRVLERHMSQVSAGVDSTEMDVDAFARAVEQHARIKDRVLQVRTETMGSKSSCYVTLINLPRSVISGAESAYGGAEAQNNRLTIAVSGWQESGAAPPAGKVQVKTLVPLLDSSRQRVQIRGKTGTPQAVAKYVAEFVSKVVETVPPKFTHSAPPPGYEKGV